MVCLNVGAKILGSTHLYVEGDYFEAEGCEHDRLGKPQSQPWGTLLHECFCSVVDGVCGLYFGVQNLLVVNCCLVLGNKMVEVVRPYLVKNH